MYKHLSGYVVLTGWTQFALTWLTGTGLTVLVMSVILLTDLKIIQSLNTRLNWSQHVLLRISTETAAAMLSGAFFGALFTAISETLFGYTEPLGEVFLYNALIGAVTNLIMIAVLESVLFYKQHQEEKLRAETLERENLGMRFELLKRQLDPHFLFNSLNVLSSLINRDTATAQDFVDEFSAIYRYTLDVIDEPLVTVERELDFIRSYMFLQQQRFGSAVRLSIEADENAMHSLLPPLAVQVLVENALKHNIVTDEQPLTIRIVSRDNTLLVVNTLQRKSGSSSGKQIGFENLKHRYHLIAGKLPEVMITEQDYQVNLPLIEPDES
ncbi:MAG: histidine kinase [candidate division KSB1 bacterium]|nr:histidine kinase [candidate division KSB1 bacterium]